MIDTQRQNLFRVALALMVGVAASVAGAQPTMIWFATAPTALSADGSSAIVGGMRWTVANGLQAIPGFYATAVNDNGTILVGSSTAGGVGRAARWTETAGVEILDLPPEVTNSTAVAVSGDGSIVVGTFNPGPVAFLWSSNAGLQVLAPCPGCGASFSPSQISGNGTVVVGQGVNPAGRNDAFRWTAAGGAQCLNFADLNGAGAATAVSFDGSVVVGWGGWSVPGIGHYSIRRWSLNQGVQILGGTYARAVSADGQIVTGTNLAGATTNGDAIAWTASTGRVDLATHFNGIGVRGFLRPPFYEAAPLYDCTGVSADGSVYIGTGLSGGGWMARGVPALSCGPYFGTRPPLSVLNQTTCVGSVVSFFVTAATAVPPLFTWMQNGTPVSLADPRIVVTTSDAGMVSTLTIFNAIVGDSGAYTCVVSDECFAATTGWDYTLAIVSAPSITTQPVSVGRIPGQSATFSVAVTSSWPAGFQWRHNGSNLEDNGRIEGATHAALTINSILPTDAGTYDVVVTSDCGSVHSDPATLDVATCRADWDANGIVNPADIGAFITAWSGSLEAGSLAGDFDRNGIVQPADVGAYVAAWFASLTGSCPP